MKTFKQYLKESTSKTLTVYHGTQHNFKKLGGNVGIGIHTSPTLSSVYEFLDASWGISNKNKIFELKVKLNNPLVMKDIGCFNCPANFLENLWHMKIFNDDEVRQLAIGFGASPETQPVDYSDFKFHGERDEGAYEGQNSPVEFNKQDLRYLQRGHYPSDIASYDEWEPTRQLLLSKGYDHLEYMNNTDAQGVNYVIFFNSQILEVKPVKYDEEILDYKWRR